MQPPERAATTCRTRLPLLFCVLLFLSLATLLGDHAPLPTTPAMAQATGAAGSGALPLGGCAPCEEGKQAVVW